MDKTLCFCAIPDIEIGDLQASTGRKQLRSIITKGSKEYSTVPRILRDELVARGHSVKHNVRGAKGREFGKTA